jgi:alpha-1,3-rhamnosyl/mannosyltransferase
MLFCPAYIAPVARRGPFVVANHGISEGLPGEFSRSDRLRTVPLYRYAVRHADRVIANSVSTRDDIIRHLGGSADRIDVVLPGAADVFFASHDSAEIRRTVAGQLGDPDARFALFVGKLSRRRHVPELIEAFAAARARLGSDHRLLIVGPDTTGIDVPARAIAHQVGDAVTYVPHLDQLALAHLYAAAEVFVLPTTHEGISWTMLEAMASGAPALTVRHAALAEGGRDSVLAVDAAGVEELAAGLERLLSDPDERRRLSAAGRSRAGQFTWRAAASATMAVLDQYAAPADR